jgi:response regulator RpfG family c-di-GMP phosphodiesterase
MLFLVGAAVMTAGRWLEAAGREAAAPRHVDAQLKAQPRRLVARLFAAVALWDNETGAHMTRVAQVAYRLALAAGCDAAFSEHLLVAAEVHDIGKIAIPAEIVFQPGPLSASERLVMQEHATLGAHILSGSELPLLKLAAEIAESHHEKWDGSGYPHGLVANAIPLAGRIVAVADVFDALLSKRRHKQAWSLEQVTNHLIEQAGRHFDPRLVDVMLSNMAPIFAIWDQHAGLTRSLARSAVAAAAGRAATEPDREPAGPNQAGPNQAGPNQAGPNQARARPAAVRGPEFCAG